MLKFLFLAVAFIYLGVNNLIGQAIKETIKIRVNPEFAVGGNASNFIEKIQYIPLLTKDVSISNILQFEITTNEYILLDKGSNSIIIFSIDGKEIGRIAPDFQINRFTLNQFQNTIEVINYPDVFEYDIRGNLLKSYKNKEMPSNSLGVVKFHSFSNEYLFYNTSKRNSDSLVYELLTYRDNSLLRSELPFSPARDLDQLDEMGIVNFHQSIEGSDTTNYYIHNFDYTVYKIGRKGIFPVYQFLFPAAMSIPIEFAKMNFKEKTSYFQSDRKAIWRLWNFNKYKELLFFKTGPDNLVYHMGTHTLLNLNMLESDSSTKFLPINLAEINQTIQVLKAEDKNIYVQIPLAYFYEKLTKDKRVSENTKKMFASYFEDLSTIDNRPILIKLTLLEKF